MSWQGAMTCTCAQLCILCNISHMQLVSKIFVTVTVQLLQFSSRLLHSLQGAISQSTRTVSFKKDCNMGCADLYNSKQSSKESCSALLSPHALP